MIRVKVKVCSLDSPLFRGRELKRKKSFRENGTTSNDCLPYEKKGKSKLWGAYLFLLCFFLVLPFRSVDDVKVIRTAGILKSTKRPFYDVKRPLRIVNPYPYCVLWDFVCNRQGENGRLFYFLSLLFTLTKIARPNTATNAANKMSNNSFQ